MNFRHQPVLLEETIKNLNIKSDGVYVDGTLGGAGHAYEICRRLSKEGRFIGIDQDADALQAAQQRLQVFDGKVQINCIKSNYRQIKSVFEQLGIKKADGILLDIGVSSYQLDTLERGFTYKEEAPLDMRMDREALISAKNVVNEYDELRLFQIIRDYGEERFAKNIAKHIRIAREKKEIETTEELAEIIKAAIPAKMRADGGHPAKRTFQAIRIEVNKELEVLEASINNMIDLLNDGGRLCIITFHSLEDRIVKNKFRENENPCICPKNFPICVCGSKSKGKVITRKPIVPGEMEILENKRSKSSKLRVFEKMA